MYQMGLPIVMDSCIKWDYRLWRIHVSNGITDCDGFMYQMGLPIVMDSCIKWDYDCDGFMYQMGLPIVTDSPTEYDYQGICHSYIVHPTILH